MNAQSSFLAGNPIHIGTFESSITPGREVIIVAKLKANKKTGLMIQLAFLDPDIDQRNIDPNRHNGQGCDNRCSAFAACYVQSFVFHIGSIARALDDYRSGVMPSMHFDDFIRLITPLELPVRVGEFGDGASVPFEVISEIIEAASDWTMYTHAWRYCDERFREVSMASVENDTDYQIAKNHGWNCFYVGGQVDKANRVIQCMNESRNVTCADCLLCRGNNAGVDIVITAHGRNAKKINSQVITI